MSIYSRNGDDGTTNLGDGRRVPKDDPRVEAYGALDEAASAIGAARAVTEEERLRELLGFAQQRLYNATAFITAPPGAPEPPGVSPDDVAFLERAIDFMERSAGASDRFLLPGGSLAAAMLHLARAIVRRAERSLVATRDLAPGGDLVGRFLNRLSDALFVAARYANRDANRSDTAWDPDAARPDW